MTHIDPDREERTAGADSGESAEASGANDEAADPSEVVRLADRMLQGLGLEVSASARDAGETIEVDLAGPDREYLLDRRGDALNAVQYLLNRILYRGRAGKRIHVDSEGFRKVREDEIVEIAVLTAEKVKANGEESVLSPLNPYERRLVHIALRDVEGVETQSLGDGFLKRVAIVPRKKIGPER
jgi:spoIIIJ-associated protein